MNWTDSHSFQSQSLLITYSPTQSSLSFVMLGVDVYGRYGIKLCLLMQIYDLHQPDTHLLSAVSQMWHLKKQLQVWLEHLCFLTWICFVLCAVTKCKPCQHLLSVTLLVRETSKLFTVIFFAWLMMVVVGRVRRSIGIFQEHQSVFSSVCPSTLTCQHQIFRDAHTGHVGYIHLRLHDCSDTQALMN